MPHSPPFNFFCAIGTGFAPPKIGPPSINNNKGIIIDKKGSICFKGFTESLPSSFAVVSPRKKAV